MPWAISPYGKWNPTIQHFFFSTAFETQFHYDWPLIRPYAAKAHRRSIAHPCPAGIVDLADTRWQATKPKQQYIYGHSWTCPTPREYAHQQLGLVISNALALHNRDAKLGIGNAAAASYESHSSWGVPPQTPLKMCLSLNNLKMVVSS